MKERIKKQFTGEREASYRRMVKSKKLEEHQRMKEALQESENKYRAIFENTGTAMAIIEEDMTISLINEECKKLIGYSKEEIENKKSWTEFVAKEDLEKFKEYHRLRRIDPHNVPKCYGVKFRNRQGNDKEVLVYIDIIQGTKRSVASVIDITEHKQTQAALEESERKYRELTDFLPQTVFELDEKGNLTFANRQGFQSFGYAAEDIDKGYNAIQMFILEDRDRVKKNIKKILGGEKSAGNEYTALRKDGSTFPVIVYSAPIIRGDKPVGLRGIIVEITERKQTEETLRGSEEKLRLMFESIIDGIMVTDLAGNIVQVNQAVVRMHGYDDKEELLGQSAFKLIAKKDQVTAMKNMRKTLEAGHSGNLRYTFLTKDGREFPAELSATVLKDALGNPRGFVTTTKDITEFTKAQKQLQHSQLLASLGEMTAGIAHEVNNPLGSILLYSELLMASDVPAEIKKDLKVIHDEAKRASKVMTDLLIYSRKVKPQMRHLDLHRILKKVMDMRRYQQKVHDITTYTNFLKGPLRVKGDALQLMQVFMNLMLNSEEAIRESNGGSIIITTSIEGEWAKVSIADDGCGIPQENLNQIFYPFFTTKQLGESAGLGLSTCYGIVTGHNGLIRAENNEMGGATFTVEIPLAQIRRQEPYPEKQKMHV